MCAGGEDPPYSATHRLQVEYQGTVLDFETPFRRATMAELVQVCGLAWQPAAVSGSPEHALKHCRCGLLWRRKHAGWMCWPLSSPQGVLRAWRQHGRQARKRCETRCECRVGHLPCCLLPKPHAAKLAGCHQAACGPRRQPRIHSRLKAGCLLPGPRRTLIHGVEPCPRWPPHPQWAMC
jgi:hypothetical protein